MDLNITFKVDSWANIKEELREGQLDILPLVGYTEERDEYFDFTVPYIIMHGNIFIREDESEIRTEEDLYGKEIIVMEGDNSHEYALRMGFTDNLILTETYQEAFELLAAGKHDAVLAQSLVGEQLIEQLNLKGIKAATRIDEDGLTEIRTNLTGFEQKFCFAVKDGDKELLSILNEGLAIVSTDGTFSKLYKKWFPFLVDNKPDPVQVMKSALIVVAPVLCVILIIAILYIRRKIKLKTEQLERTNQAMLEMESHLRTQQKLESLGVLASGVAHEINNPVNGILNYGQIILDTLQNTNENLSDHSDTVIKYSIEIINESKRISSVVTNLLQFSRNENKQFKETNVKDIIDNILNLVSTIIRHDQISIEVDVQSDLPKIHCRSQEIQQVLMNLLINAKDAMNQKYEGFHKNKVIIIKAQKHASDIIDGVRIMVEDHGNGISNEITNKIFDPFFTTKSRAEGTGLGLSISFNIIKEHNGVLGFETKKGSILSFISISP